MINQLPYFLNWSHAFLSSLAGPVAYISKRLVYSKYIPFHPQPQDGTVYNWMLLRQRRKSYTVDYEVCSKINKNKGMGEMQR